MTSIGESAFGECTGLTSFRFPNQLETLSVNVLSDCKVKSIIIPASVKTIEQGAFVRCQQLEDVYCLSTAVPTTHYLTFYNLNTKNVTLHVYAESVNAYSSANVWKDLKQVVALTPEEIATLLKSDIVQIDGLYYYLDKGNYQAWVAPMPDGKYTGNIEIPDYIRYEGEVYSVTGIGKSAFEGCSGLTSVTIPNSVTSIGDYAFYGCSGLTTVTLNSNAIVSKAYYNDSSLKEYFGSQVQSYIIGNSVTSIGNAAFRGCSGLTSVTIPNSVTSIGDYAFYGCSGLTSIEIPNSVTSIGSYALEDCSGLASVTIPNSVTSIGFAAFRGCSGLTSIEIPNSVTSIGSYALEDCSGLASIEIPNSVTSIGVSPFAGCSGLTSIHVDDNNPKYDSRNNCNAIIEKETNTLVAGCKNTHIPNSVTSIGTYAFRGCSGLTSIEIPNSVTSIGTYAFRGCSGLTSIVIPNSVTSIGDATFSECSGLTSVTIPNSVTSIGNWAFLGCTGLTSITIPNSVTSIGAWAFYGCSGLTSVKVYAKTPIAISFGTFPTSQAMTLYVPRGSKAAYQTASGWKDFSSIIEFDDIIKGDANGDGEVNVSDIVEIVNYIMNKPSDKFVFAAADMNDDGEVNVTDIVMVVSIIMSSDNNAPKHAAVAEMVDNDQLEMTSNDNHTLSLNLQNVGSYVASQFDVVLSAGQTLEGIQLNSKRMENHQMTYAKTDDNRYKVVIYSLNNAAYKGQSGELLNIKVAGSGDVSVEDILFVTAGQMEKRFPPLHRGTTGISVITNEAETMDIYTIDGRLIRKQAKSTDGLEKGLYIINGKKQIVR